MQKLKIFGLGGMGCNVIGKIPDTEKLPIFALDTCVCPFNWLNCEKLLCGENLCRGVGCGGDVETGYNAAVETLKDNIQLFYENEINIFVLGFGGGTGSGIIKFILQNLHNSKDNPQNKNKCNILIATFPLDVEKNRIIKANKVIEEISSLYNLILLLKFESLVKKMNTPSVNGIFEITRVSIANLLVNICKLDNCKLLEYVKVYSKDNLIHNIENIEDFNNLFSNTKKVNPKILVNMNTHFTGQGRDLEQLKSLKEHLNESDSILFVGCSTGEEIVDLQSLNPLKKLSYFGIDYDSQIVMQANEKEYIVKPKIFSADILKDNFIEVIEKNTNLTAFNIVICRNLLIYYKEDIANGIICKLANITEELLILGISDPFDFIIKDDKVEIGNHSFKVLDFDNRIFKKIKI